MATAWSKRGFGPHLQAKNIPLYMQEKLTVLLVGLE